MAQPIVINDNSLAEGIRTAGGALAQALAQSGVEEKKKLNYRKSASVLDDILSKMPENPTAIDIQKAVFSAGKNPDMDPEYLNQAFGTLMPLYTQKMQAAENQKLMQSLGIGPQQTAPMQNPPSNEDLRSDAMQMQGMAPFLSQEQRQEQGVPMDFLSVNRPQAQPQQQQGTQVQPSNNLAKLNDDQLMAMKLTGNPTLSKAVDFEKDRRKDAQAAFVEDRKYYTDINKEGEKHYAGLKETMSKKRLALNTAIGAVRSRKVNALSMANLAERTGFKELMSPEGALLIAASKENLIANMSRVSARAQNQWLEQRINSIFPQIGHSQAANEELIALLEGELALDQAYVDAYANIKAQDIEKYGYPRGDIRDRAYEAIKDQEADIYNRTAYKTRQIYEADKGPEWLKRHANEKVPQGTYLTPEMNEILVKQAGGDHEKAAKNAQRLGYEAISPEDIKRWQ